MLPIELILLITGILLLLSIISSKASSLLGLPALLLFILIGILAGSEGLGGIYFDDPWVAQFLGVLALIFILFSGGLDTTIDNIRPVLGSGFSLATIGVVITTVSVGWFSQQILGFTLLEGLLLGAIVSSTDAAAVFSVLGSGGVRLNERVENVLQLESGSNDPMAVFLTLGLTSLLILPDTPIENLLFMFIQQMVLGLLLGAGTGYLLMRIINKLRLTYDGLYPVLTISVVLITYGVTTVVGGSGFLAVYIIGIVLNNSDFIHKNSLKRFHDGLAWLMQIFMFLVLGLLVFPSELVPDMTNRVLIALFLIFVARPLSVMVALLFSRFSFRERVLISWVGLRGAAPIVLGTFPLLAGVPGSDTIFNIVFFVVITSVIIQGPLIVPIARWLGLQNPRPLRPKSPLEYQPAFDIESQLSELIIPADSAVINLQVVDLHLPADALIVLIGRDQSFIVPNGGTLLQAEDTLLVLADKSYLKKLRRYINTPISL